MTLARVWFGDGECVLTFCPGCKMAHQFRIKPGQSEKSKATWEWNGSLEAPTFSPSLLCYGSVHLCEGEHEPQPCPNPDSCGQLGHLIMEGDVRGHNTPHTRDPAWGNCHSFLRDGQWQFLADSAHALAGQTVPMVPLPDWLMP